MPLSCIVQILVIAFSVVVRDILRCPWYSGERHFRTCWCCQVIKPRPGPLLSKRIIQLKI